jgi:hypothetical protein
LVEEIKPLKSWDERLEHFIMRLPKTDHSVQHLKAVGTASYMRLKAMANYKWGHTTTIKSHTTLLRSTIMALKTEEDYGLSKVRDHSCKNKIKKKSCNILEAGSGERNDYV